MTNPSTRRIATDEGPGLRQAKIRVMRAVHRHTELRALEHQGRSDPNAMRVTADRSDWEAGRPVSPKLDWSGARPIDTTHAKLLTSEIVHHLRAALDYVAYNLVLLDAGAPSRGKQRSIFFPVVRERSRWTGEAKGRLPGVSQAHLALVREYQPFAGCAWTGLLADLAMEERHRFVLDVIREYSGTMVNAPERVSVDPLDQARVVFETGPVDFRFLLPNEEPAVSTLTDIAKEVALLLQRLQTDFGESDVLTFSPE